MRPAGRGRRDGIYVLVVAGVLFAGLILFSGGTRHWLRTRMSSSQSHHYTLSPVGFGLKRHTVQLYPAHDRWAAFLPKPELCAQSTNASASTTDAQAAMICSLNFARVRDGLKALAVSPLLQRSARLKALDIIRCHDFSHAACGKNPHAVADEVGYPNVDWGENGRVESSIFVCSQASISFASAPGSVLKG